MKTYTATTTQHPPRQNGTASPIDPAAIQTMSTELDALALKLDQGLALLNRLLAEESPRYDEVRGRWDILDARWRNLYERYDASLGTNPHICGECKLEAGEEVDWKRVPLTARLCTKHAKVFQAARARLRWPQK